MQFLLENIQTAVLVHDNFRTFAMAYKTPDRINEVGLLWMSVPLMIGLSM